MVPLKFDIMFVLSEINENVSKTFYQFTGYIMHSVVYERYEIKRYTFESHTRVGNIQFQFTIVDAVNTNIIEIIINQISGFFLKKIEMNTLFSCQWNAVFSHLSIYSESITSFASVNANQI